MDKILGFQETARERYKLIQSNLYWFRDLIPRSIDRCAILIYCLYQQIPLIWMWVGIVMFLVYNYCTYLMSTPTSRNESREKMICVSNTVSCFLRIGMRTLLMVIKWKAVTWPYRNAPNMEEMCSFVINCVNFEGKKITFLMEYRWYCVALMKTCVFICACQMHLLHGITCEPTRPIDIYFIYWCVFNSMEVA